MKPTNNGSINSQLTQVQVNVSQMSWVLQDLSALGIVY